MKSLNCLSDECTRLLHRNKLLRPLIKAELTNEVLRSVKLKHEVFVLKEQLRNKFLNELNTKDINVYKKWLLDQKIDEDKL